MNILSRFKADAAERYGVSRIGVFGSVARGEQRDDSDLDVVVEMEHPTWTLMYDLREHLSTLFNCPVDVVRYRQSLRPSLKQSIDKEALYV